jgi:hypothetical protein
MIREMVDKSDSSDRIAVAACGPDGLMQITRRSVASCIGVEGPSLELFFGAIWLVGRVFEVSLDLTGRKLKGRRDI